jgi:predicted  nucleic acid-binding Zn-ribbon protein
MVQRSDLLAAQGELKARNEDLQAKEKELAWLQEQLRKAQEQYNAARQDAAQLRAEMGGMVLRSELDAVRAALTEREGAGKSDSQAQAKAVGELNGRIGALEKEKAELLLKMQVGSHAAFPFIQAYPYSASKYTSV